MTSIPFNGIPGHPQTGVCAPSQVSPGPSIAIIATDERLTRSDWMPTRAHDSAGMDLRAMLEDGKLLALQPGEARLVPTGLRVWVKNPNWVGMIYPRSGTGHKRGLVLGNGTGVIDADYQGPLMVSLLNRTSEVQVIEFGERIAQFVVLPVIRPELEFVVDFDQATTRGDGGFGSTGTK